MAGDSEVLSIIRKALEGEFTSPRADVGAPLLAGGSHGGSRAVLAALKANPDVVLRALGGSRQGQIHDGTHWHWRFPVLPSEAVVPVRKS